MSEFAKQPVFPPVAVSGPQGLCVRDHIAIQTFQTYIAEGYPSVAAAAMAFQATSHFLEERARQQEESNVA